MYDEIADISYVNRTLKDYKKKYLIYHTEAAYCLETFLFLLFYVILNRNSFQ